MPSYTVLGSMVPELHAMRMVCLLKAFSPAWVTNTIPLLFVFDYIRYSRSFEVLQAMVDYHLLVGPASMVLRALNKHYSPRGGPINVSFMYVTWGCYVNILDKFHNPRVKWWLFT